MNIFVEIPGLAPIQVADELFDNLQYAGQMGENTVFIGMRNRHCYTAVYNSGILEKTWTLSSCINHKRKEGNPVYYRTGASTLTECFAILDRGDGEMWSPDMK